MPVGASSSHSSGTDVVSLPPPFNRLGPHGSPPWQPHVVRRGVEERDDVTRPSPVTGPSSVSLSLSPPLCLSFSLDRVLRPPPRPATPPKWRSREGTGTPARGIARHREAWRSVASGVSAALVRVRVPTWWRGVAWRGVGARAALCPSDTCPGVALSPPRRASPSGGGGERPP